MQFDPNNKIVQLCAKGMEMEGLGDSNQAKSLFNEAWETATNDTEKFIAAHYVARHQKSIEEKLKWDKIALNLALKSEDSNMKGALPSLYLNIAKGYEDLNDFEKAYNIYDTALSHQNHLLDDGYGKMIKGGIMDGIERVTKKYTDKNE